MAEKSLTETEWKKFAKGRELKDAALLKAMAAFDKAEGADADARLKALTEIDVQADLLKASKAVRGDKDVLAYLGQIDKAVEKERKVAETAAQAEQDADDSPVQLSARLVPLMRSVRKGEALNALVAVLGKEAVVLVSRKAVGMPQRKLLAAQFEASGTPKYAVGQCIFEAKAHTFVLQTQAAGLAKKVKAALLKQTDIRYKVRVRGEDPDDLDDDGDEVPVDDEIGAPGAPSAGEESTAEATPSRSREQLAYEAQLQALAAPFKEAMTARPGDAAKLKALMKYAVQKADAGAHAEALQGLEALALVLKGKVTTGAQPTATAGTGGVKPSEAFNARLAALLPSVTKALKTGGDLAAELKKTVSDAGTAARDKTYDVAGQLLDKAEKLLEQIGAAGRQGEPQKAGEADEAEWLRRFEATETVYLTVLAQNPADATRLRAVMSFANDQAADKEYAKAIGALDRLDGMLAEAQAAGTTTETGYEGLVAYRKALVELRKAVTNVNAQIEALKAAIPASVPDEAELAEDLAEALLEYTADLYDAVDVAMNTSENTATPVTKAVVAELDSFSRDLRANPLVKHVDANPFKVPMNVAGTLGSALDAARKAMPALR